MGIEEGLLIGRDNNRPRSCDKCGAKVEYVGVGEYVCSECGNVMYDDYGKVRKYIEEHRGATQGQVAEATGVPANTIRQLLREERIEISPNSNIFMNCEGCGTQIRSGRFCAACASKRTISTESSSRSSSRSIQGFGTGRIESSGAKRFNR